jgi:hypothetical protein
VSIDRKFKGAVALAEESVRGKEQARGGKKTTRGRGEAGGGAVTAAERRPRELYQRRSRGGRENRAEHVSGRKKRGEGVRGPVCKT